MSLDFTRRSDAPELMDTETADFETFRDCLVDLAKVNRLTLAHRPTLAFLERLRQRGRLETGRPLRIVDAGSGYGDLLRAIGRWASRHGVPVALTGVDLNPWSARAAAAADVGAREIDYVTRSIFEYTGDCDLVVSSLFTHHLDDAALLAFLRWMEARTTLGWFVNDLHRHPLPYHVFKAASRAMGYHRFVQHDGPVSIARAFSREDWRRSLDAAGVKAEIEWYFPFRLCVARVKP